MLSIHQRSSRPARLLFVIPLLIAIIVCAVRARGGDFDWLLFRKECVKVTRYGVVGIGWRWTPRLGFAEPELRYQLWHPYDGTLFVEEGEKRIYARTKNVLLDLSGDGDGTNPPSFSAPRLAGAREPVIEATAPWLETNLTAEEWWITSGAGVDSIP